MKSSLISVKRALKGIIYILILLGLVVMSDDLEKLANSLFDN